MSTSIFVNSKIAAWAFLSLILIASITKVEAYEEITKDEESQLICLAQNIYYEAGMESFEGKVAVAQVTLNRAESGRFPPTICGVVHQKTRVSTGKIVCQFSWVCNPPAAIKLYSDRWKDSIDIANSVLFGGERLDILAESMHFHNTHVNPRWKLVRVNQIGNHIFYK